MLLHFLVLGLALLALLPVLMVGQNLRLFQRLPVASKKSGKVDGAPAKLSVLIPARDEEASIVACLERVLVCPWADLEVIVMDDCSSDQTYALCQQLAQRDPRLRVLQGRELPMGWNGKQRACWQLALAASGQWLLFLDADVRLSDDALPRLLEAVEGKDIDLLSGFPKQVTGSWLEKLLIPLMHFILLGYLPLQRMRASTGPEFAAGCGQLFLARRTSYMTCEGHKAICNSRHDGLKLPRAFRKQHFKTDIFDATDVAECRMYHNAPQVLRGLLKNATEGIANPRTIVIFTLLLAGAAVIPLAWLTYRAYRAWPNSIADAGWVDMELAVVVLFSYVPRLTMARRFQHAWLGVILHPLAVALFLILQWLALLGELIGWKIRWRGRS